jgi:pyruvate dehydrogenase E2 component (dihydrolipoamide acetyltransferase)
VDQALDYIDSFRSKTGRRLTLSHMMARAVSQVLVDVPQANSVLRLGSLSQRESVAVSFQVTKTDPKTGKDDLSGTTLRDAHKKSLLEIIDEFEKETRAARDGSGDKERSRELFRNIPGVLVGPMLRTVGFVHNQLNLDLTRFGIPNDPFGSVMVTNIGSLGLEEAYPPLIPYSGVPMIIAMGAVVDAPVVEEGEIVPGKLMRVCASFDHRIIDGSHAARMVRHIRGWLESPADYFEEI